MTGVAESLTRLRTNPRSVTAARCSDSTSPFRVTVVDRNSDVVGVASVGTSGYVAPGNTQTAPAFTTPAGLALPLMPVAPLLSPKAATASRSPLRLIADPKRRSEYDTGTGAFT